MRAEAGRGVYAISVAPSWWAWSPRRCASMSNRACLNRPAPPATAATTLRRIAELVSTGLNLVGVGMVVDLQDANTRLQADLDTRRQSPTARSKSRHER